MVGISVVDLFAGCGGFSLGAKQAGMSVSAAYDSDPVLTSSFIKNFPGAKILHKDISNLDACEVRSVSPKIDGIVGGPPCQGFSAIGRRVRSDPRRKLLYHFFRLVGELQPKFFVMENVCGLAYKDARAELCTALGLIGDKYELLGPSVWNAANFGAATDRARLFVIGIHKIVGNKIVEEDVFEHLKPSATVKAAIADLENAKFLGECRGFDVWKIVGKGQPSSYAKDLRAKDRIFTGHKATTHTDAVRIRFEKIPQGGRDLIGRHPRLLWSGLCPTLRAGTGPDRGSYQSVRPLHPVEPRVITVREAARLQGFPDHFLFHPTIWHSFRMIGNSVSPIIAKAIFKSIAAKDCC